MKTWTDKENKFLRKAYNNEPINKIAKALMRSKQSIRNHVHILRKKGFAFDRVRDVEVQSVSQKMQDELEPIIHQSHTKHNFFVPSTEHDESDDLEAAKAIQQERIEKDKRRKMIWKALEDDEYSRSYDPDPENLVKNGS